MSDLKTLKDLDLKDCPNEAFTKARIKQEAIKWVKHCMSKGQTEKALVLIEFNNLTEDDLK